MAKDMQPKTDTRRGVGTSTTTAILPQNWELSSDDKVLKLTCPVCRTVLRILRHRVDKYGNLSPSLQCPGCGFVNDVCLQDWNRGEWSLPTD